MKPVEKLEDVEKYNPKFGESFQLGGDFRSLYWSTEGDAVMSSFLTMQADLYLAVTPSDKLLLYVERGIGSAYEAFALLQGLPNTGVLKIGRFIPAYGLRFDDHKSYVRDFLGFAQYAQRGERLIEDSGVEFGMYPMRYEFTVALTNGGSSTIDADKGKAVTVRAIKRNSLAGANVTLGASYRYADFARKDNLLRYAGGFIGIYRSPFTYVGEVDWIVRSGVTGIAATHLVAVQPMQGVEIIAGYDYFDSDLDLKTGDSFRYRLVSKLHATGYFEVSPALYYEESSLSDAVTKYTTGELQFHVWF